MYFSILYYTFVINKTTMSNIVIYLRLETYLKQWLIHSFGLPVRFPAKSNENAIIRRFIQRQPVGQTPEIASPELLPIVIPDSCAKDPEIYNYMGPLAKAALTEAIEDMFRMNLWAELSGIVEQSHKGINGLVAAWCELHGIDLDAQEAVRQKFYRMRKAYAKKNLVLYKSTKKIEKKQRR